VIGLVGVVTLFVPPCVAPLLVAGRLAVFAATGWTSAPVEADTRGIAASRKQ
jgi:hypothetical protein